MVTSEQAARHFIQRILFGAYRDTYTYIESGLAEGLPGRVDEPLNLEKWYQNLDDNQKLLVKSIVQASIRAAIFEVLVLVDNMTGGYPITGQLSDFALTLQTYIDSEARYRNQPQESVRFNSIGDYELHDLFIDSLEESGNFLAPKQNSGDGLAIQHIPPKQAAAQVLPGYDKITGPAIAIPKGEHEGISGGDSPGAYSGTARELLEETLNTLMDNTHIPPEAYSAIQALWRSLWPDIWS
jgi:hypothetical protein